MGQEQLVNVIIIASNYYDYLHIYKGELTPIDFKILENMRQVQKRKREGSELRKALSSEKQFKKAGTLTWQK